MNQYPVEILSESTLICSTWFERDRKNIRLETEEGDEVVNLWDCDVDAAIASGFLGVPRTPNASDADWLPHVVEFARQAGMFVVFEVPCMAMDDYEESEFDRPRG